MREPREPPFPLSPADPEASVHNAHNSSAKLAMLKVDLRGPVSRLAANSRSRTSSGDPNGRHLSWLRPVAKSVTRWHRPAIQSLIRPFWGPLLLPCPTLNSFRL